MDNRGIIYVNSGNRIIALNNAPLSDSNLSSGIKNITYGDKLSVNINLNKDATGFVSIQIGDVYINESTVKDGEASFVLEDLDSGNYTAEITYSGDARFESKSINAKFEVKKISPTIEIAANDINALENLNVNVKLSHNLNATVEISVGEKSQDLNIENGIGNTVFNRLDAGLKTVLVSYSGDVNYNSAFASKNITVSKINVSVGITADDIFCGDDLVVGVSFDANVSGSVVVSVDGVGKTVAVVDGRASVVFSDLTEGVKKVDVNYPGDIRYNPAFASKNITVSKINTAIFILADDVNYGDLLEVIFFDL